MFANFSLQIYDNFSIFKYVYVKNFALGCVDFVFYVPLYSNEYTPNKR